ncbi:peptide/nickel transport system ATP-binding protein [Mesorhizobium sp. J18]|uniref:ABC transporter ATP-binding protein n=1 Tax=Mesorhizobium sp. J18 TaxID=935263 RepID=UPI00119A8F43|nr:oligopeptide/dipeptide ABC transporter ATP-binding protein [Mesorhizobium sp. J18]TWG94901.1 peptide/nickel transport system ATP-binding protein [Mesorhizobium sp. J18]
MSADIITAQGLVKDYASRRGMFAPPTTVRAVDGVSLSVERASTLGIVGESGSGKSTTGRLLLGIEPSSKGSISFDGRPIPAAGTSEWRRLRARMQLIYQDPLAALDRRLTIADQVREPLDVHNIGDAAERRERVHELLAAVGLRPDHGRSYPHELSGGQRQRAVLARALASRPEFLVCDEPVSALDVSIQAQVVNLLTDLQERFSIAMLFISHDLKVVRNISDRVAVMYLGRIVEEGSSEDIFREPLHPYTQALVSSVPQPGTPLKERIILQGEPPNPANRPSGCAFHPRCRFATARCRSETPALKQTTDDRSVACHLVAVSTAQPSLEGVV